MCRWHPLLACPLVLLVFCGCGDGRERTYEVRGQVFAGDRPAANALVTFHPVGGVAAGPVHPTATVDDSGNFTLTSYKTGDGAPAGEYQVTVVWYLAVKSGSGPEDYATRNFLPARYGAAETSQLRATVTKGNNQLEPFRLSPR
jgi:hypothetical protein